MKNTVNLTDLAKKIVLVAVASSVINVILAVVGKMISQPPATFGPYMTGPVVGLTVLGVIAAGFTFAAMRAWYTDTKKANKHFIILSVLVLIASFYPDVAMPWSTDADQVGWTYGIIANLMLMHVVAAALVIYYFPRVKGVTTISNQGM